MRRYIIESFDRNFFEHANLYDGFYVTRLNQEFEPYRWGDEERLELLEVVLRRLDASKAREDRETFLNVQPLVTRCILFSEKVMENIMHSQHREMKERTAELIRRLLVDWTS